MTCKLRDVERDEVYYVKACVHALGTSPWPDLMRAHSKYLIGADGGKSMVRKAAQIPFEGSSSGAEWIRMDVRRRAVPLTHSCEESPHRPSSRRTCRTRGR